MTHPHITKKEFHALNKALEYFENDYIKTIENEDVQSRLFFLTSIMQNEAERMIE